MKQDIFTFFFIVSLKLFYTLLNLTYIDKTGNNSRRNKVNSKYVIKFIHVYPILLTRKSSI